MKYCFRDPPSALPFPPYVKSSMPGPRKRVSSVAERTILGDLHPHRVTLPGVLAGNSAGPGMDNTTVRGMEGDVSEGETSHFGPRLL